MAEAGGGKVESVSPTDRWMRLLYMVIFAIIGYAVYWLVVFLAVVQFGLTLLTGHPNENLKDFAAKLDAYLKSVTDFLGYATDVVPFPFSPLDQGAASAAAKPSRKRASRAATKTSAKPKPTPRKEPAGEDDNG